MLDKLMNTYARTAVKPNLNGCSLDFRQIAMAALNQARPLLDSSPGSFKINAETAVWTDLAAGGSASVSGCRVPGVIDAGGFAMTICRPGSNFYAEHKPVAHAERLPVRPAEPRQFPGAVFSVPAKPLGGARAYRKGVRDIQLFMSAAWASENARTIFGRYPSNFVSWAALFSINRHPPSQDNVSADRFRWPKGGCA